jgi:excisionase family DNA binding protein
MSTSMLHTVSEAAELLRVSLRTISTLVSRGDLIPTRIGDRVLFHRDEINRFSREGSRALKAITVNRKELDKWTLQTDGPLRFVLESLADSLDGQPFDKEVAEAQAMQLAGPLLSTLEAKRAKGERPTCGEKLTLRYLGLALLQFAGDELETA